MLRKYMSLAILILHLTVLFSFSANAQTSTDTQLAERIKADVRAIGVGERVSVRLRNNRRITGRITQIEQDQFVITNSRDGSAQTITYTDATQINRRNGRGLSTRTKVIIGVLGAAWLVGLIMNGGG